MAVVDEPGDERRLGRPHGGADSLRDPDEDERCGHRARLKGAGKTGGEERLEEG